MEAPACTETLPAREAEPERIKVEPDEDNAEPEEIETIPEEPEREVPVCRTVWPDPAEPDVPDERKS